MRGSQHPEMSEAQRLAQMIQSNDLVVGDWDGVSVAYGYAWAADGQKAQQKGGRVFFLSILDVPRETWESFLGSRFRDVPLRELIARQGGG